MLNTTSPVIIVAAIVEIVAAIVEIEIVEIVIVIVDEDESMLLKAIQEEHEGENGNC